jgi:uncharacterized BrkB/YihY/UPF0761 family membrane protein
MYQPPRQGFSWCADSTPVSSLAFRPNSAGRTEKRTCTSGNPSRHVSAWRVSGTSPPMDPFRAILHAVDRWQQRTPPAAFLFAIVKKFGDDRGGQLASLVVFSAFLSFFPLMLVVVTTTSFIAQRYKSLAVSIRTSAISEFPVVGTELTQTTGKLPGSGLGLVVGFVLLLWGGLGFAHALQNAFLEIWHVPHKIRPSWLTRMQRSVVLFGVLVVGVIATVVFTFIGALITNGTAATVAGLAVAYAVSVGLYLWVFWLLSPRTVRIVALLPGVLIAALGWQALQVLGIRLVGTQLRRSSELYGTIGAALGLIWFLLLTTQILLYALEVTVVWNQHLWPRSLIQPPLTASDQTVLTALVMQEERQGESVSVEFETFANSAAEAP